MASFKCCFIIIILCFVQNVKEEEVVYADVRCLQSVQDPAVITFTRSLCLRFGIGEENQNMNINMYIKVHFYFQQDIFQFCSCFTSDVQRINKMLS